MNSIYDARERLKYIFIFAAILIAIVSVVVSDILIKDLAREEREKIEVWAEATRVVTSEEPSLNMNLILKIIQGNTTIPVLLCNDRDSVLTYKNIELPETGAEAFLQQKLKEFKNKNVPIAVDMEDGTFQYLYYDDSTNLKRLLVYPYAQLSVMAVFILIAFLALASTKKAEQNKVWVGLSKETAHQLGTPISSLIAWIEYLKTKDVDAYLLGEMDKDVKRLEMIAERFSKIGSLPELKPSSLNVVLEHVVGYIARRTSNKVKMEVRLPVGEMEVMMCAPLFEWVIENLCKNAIDAMDGCGQIVVCVMEEGSRVAVEVSDTGKGIPRNHFQTVFSPGFTTKKRGWGLGLSLAKRIVEEYHGGRIFVKSSEIGVGTTFRVELKKS